MLKIQHPLQQPRRINKLSKGTSSGYCRPNERTRCLPFFYLKEKRKSEMEKHGPDFQANSTRCLPKLHSHASACKCIVPLVICLNCIHIFLRCLLEHDTTRMSSLPGLSEIRAWAHWWEQRKHLHSSAAKTQPK